MSHDDDEDTEVHPRQVIAEAIARGISAEDQYFRLNKACDKCKNAKAKGIVDNIMVQVHCLMTCTKASIILDNKNRIDKAIFGVDEDLPPTRPEQDQSDEWYHREYWQYAGRPKAAIQKEFDRIRARERNGQPVRPIDRAWSTALFDLLQGRAYDPPLLEPGASSAPPPQPDEYSEPEGMRALSVRGRPGKAARGNPGKRKQVPMPVSGFWLTETTAEPTVHFAIECPTQPAEHSDFQLLDEAMLPLDVVEDIGGNACGSCMKILEAGARKGFLFNTVSGWRTLVVRHDGIDYQTPKYRPRGKNFTITPDELEDVYFSSPTKLVLVVPEHGEIAVRLDSPAEGDVACEAFRRLGWNMDE